MLVCLPVWGSAGGPFLSPAERLGPTILTGIVASQSASMVDPPFLPFSPTLSLSSHLQNLIAHQASPYKSLVLPQLSDQTSSHFLRSSSLPPLSFSSSLLCGVVFWLPHRLGFTTSMTFQTAPTLQHSNLTTISLLAT